LRIITIENTEGEEEEEEEEEEEDDIVTRYALFYRHIWVSNFCAYNKKTALSRDGI